MTDKTDQTSSGHININVWMSHQQDYLFPEMSLANPPAKTAICFSGGGTRAMSATMGQLRAMTKIGTLKGAGYISCVSGGSWASTIYTYYQSGAANDEELLGPITEPAEITLDHIQHGLTSSQLAYGASKDFWATLKGLLEKSVLGHESGHRVWIDAVGETFLQPFGLYQKGQPQAIYTLNNDTENDIKSRNKYSSFVNNAHFIQAHKSRPFLVVNSCIIWPYGLWGEYEASFEYTPLAVGNPLLQKFEGDFSSQWVGGGFIENFAYGCSSPGTALRGKGKGEYNVNVTSPQTVFGVNDATGTSSAAFSADAAEFLTKALSPYMNYWPVTPQGNTSSDTQQDNQYFGDGGSLDNFGLINMVRRGIKAALVFINTSTVLQPGYTGQSWPTGKPEEVDSDFAKLFGYEPQEATYNNKIFTRQDFIDIVSDFQQARTNGGPIYSARHLTVQKNDWWGIQGGQNIYVVFVYLGRCKKWEEQLDPEVAKWMNIGGKGQFDDFPNYKTVGQNWSGFDFRLVQLTSAQITALADLTCWCCQQFLGSPDIIESFKEN